MHIVSHHRGWTVVILLFGLLLGVSSFAYGQPTGRAPNAMIHWVDVPLRDAIGRLGKLFDDEVFLDRRLDPTARITLDARAASAEGVLAQVALERGWGVSRIGRVVYMGPAAAAQRLRGIAKARAGDAAHLTGALRVTLERRRPVVWPRLTEPRALVESIIEGAGWSVADAERIPHDLWSAGSLPGLSITEQLTVLLLGFDLTFKIHVAEQTIQIVPLASMPDAALADAPVPQAPSRGTTRAPGGTKQIYSLRVEEKPVGAVVRELGRRLNWQIEFEEAAIRAAGLSLEARISFAVEDVEADELLDAVLRPAGLSFRREGARIIVAPR